MMRELDFGMAMLKAKSSVKERLLSGQTIKERSPKPRLHGEKGSGKRFHLFIGSLLNSHSREKVHLPSVKEIKALRSGGLLLKR